jgi:hypothetical protein
VAQEVANVRQRLGLDQLPAPTIVERSPSTLLGAIGHGLDAEAHQQVDDQLARMADEREAAGQS